MDASIVAIGLIVLHAFATAVLWFELRSYERASKDRIDRMTATILDAIDKLRAELLPAGGPGGGPGGAAAEGGPSSGPGFSPAPALRTAIGMSRPFQPSAMQIAEARSLPSGAVSSETPSAMKARIEAAEDERDRKRKLAAAAQEAAARAVAKVDGVEVEDARATVEIPATQLPPLAPSEGSVSEGDRDSDATHVYDTGARRTIYGMPTLASMGTLLGWLSDLSPEDLARVDALADEVGIGREEMLGKLFGAGSAAQSANDASTAPPPSGPRRS